MALIIILSVFNGLETMVRSIFNTFDPDIKITAAEGKTFIADTSQLKLLANVEGISCYSLAIEENALLKYGERQYIATIKGVDDNYAMVTDIDSTMWEGDFILRSDRGRPYAIPGVGVAQYLGIQGQFYHSAEYICSTEVRQLHECRKCIHEEVYLPLRNISD